MEKFQEQLRKKDTNDVSYQLMLKNLTDSGYSMEEVKDMINYDFSTLTKEAVEPVLNGGDILIKLTVDDMLAIGAMFNNLIDNGVILLDPEHSDFIKNCILDIILIARKVMLTKGPNGVLKKKFAKLDTNVERAVAVARSVGKAIVPRVVKLLLRLDFNYLKVTDREYMDKFKKLISFDKEAAIKMFNTFLLQQMASSSESAESKHFSKDFDSLFKVIKSMKNLSIMPNIFE